MRTKPTNSGGQSTTGGSTAGGSSPTAPTSAGVSTGGSSSNSGNVRLLTQVSSGFVEDLSSCGRYNGGSLHHFRVLQELSCPIHDMSSTTDDDGHWEFAHDVDDLSHVRTVTYVPQPGEPIEVLLDSGADGSALPLSFGHMGVSVGGSHGMNYVLNPKPCSDDCWRPSTNGNRRLDCKREKQREVQRKV